MPKNDLQSIYFIFRWRVNFRKHMRVGYISQGKILNCAFVLLAPYKQATLPGLLFGYRYWEPTYEDSLNLIARLPAIAAYIYRRYVKHIILISVTHLTSYGVL